MATCSPPIGIEFTGTASGNLQPTTLKETKGTGEEGENGAHAGRVDLGDGRASDRTYKTRTDEGVTDRRVGRAAAVGRHVEGIVDVPLAAPPVLQT